MWRKARPVLLLLCLKRALVLLVDVVGVVLNLGRVAVSKKPDLHVLSSSSEAGPEGGVEAVVHGPWRSPSLNVVPGEPLHIYLFIELSFIAKLL